MFVASLVLVTLYLHIICVVGVGVDVPRYDLQSVELGGPGRADGGLGAVPGLRDVLGGARRVPVGDLEPAGVGV